MNLTLQQNNEVYNPDNWVVLKIKEGKGTFPFYKILAGWYTIPPGWRINSGITEVKEDGDYYDFYGKTGSCYRCHKHSYGLRMNNKGIYNEMRELQQFKGQLFMMPEDTEWMQLLCNGQ